MKVLVCGATGLIGKELVKQLVQAGEEVIACRRPPKELADVDVVVHLGGKNIAGGKWTKQLKKEILDSRVESTNTLVQLMAKAAKRPKTFICASAIGFYGAKRNELLTEGVPVGTGFLAEVCQAWETAAQGATELGVRVVSARFGMVLSRRGGALKRMLLPFKLGIGGRLGSGEQRVCWITCEDAARAIIHCIQTASLSGPVNIVAPQVASNKEFTRTLAHALNRPAAFPMPAVLLRLVLGQMANELLLSDLVVVPEKLHKSGFAFHHPRLDQALHAALSD